MYRRLVPVVFAALIVVGPASGAAAQTLPPSIIPTATTRPTPTPSPRRTVAPTRRPTPRASATPRTTPTPSPSPSPTPLPTPTPSPQIVRVPVSGHGGWWFFAGLVAGGLVGRASWVWQRRLRAPRL